MQKFLTYCPVLVLLLLPLSMLAQTLSHTTPEQAEGQALLESLRQGGLVLYFRHTDTFGMPCDSGYRIGERAGQRNISEGGREQARAIGQALQTFAVPVAYPVLAGPVFRARDTAELAFGAERVQITADLLADDYTSSIAQLREVLSAHLALMSELPPPGLNRVLVGHRTPAVMVLGQSIGGRAFPEGAALVLRPRPGELPEILGILQLAEPPGGGFHEC